MGTKRCGHKETWAQNTTFWAQRDVGTKYHFFWHIETWAQRDVGTKRCFDNMYGSLLTLLDQRSANGTNDLDLTVLFKGLYSFGANGTVLKSFVSYITNRTQPASVGDIHYSSLLLKYGVHLGSLLLTILFTPHPQPASN